MERFHYDTTPFIAPVIDKAIIVVEHAALFAIDHDTDACFDFGFSRQLYACKKSINDY